MNDRELQALKARAFRIAHGRLISIRTRYASNQGIVPDAEAYDLVQLIFGDAPVPSRSLPAAAIERDRELEKEGDERALQYHRWHWTLNPLNDEAVSIGEYALAIDRHRSQVFTFAQGYADDLAGGPPRGHRR
jgi:hypothetical protein